MSKRKKSQEGGARPSASGNKTAKGKKSLEEAILEQDWDFNHDGFEEGVRLAGQVEHADKPEMVAALVSLFRELVCRSISSLISI